MRGSRRPEFQRPQRQKRLRARDPLVLAECWFQALGELNAIYLIKVEYCIAFAEQMPAVPLVLSIRGRFLRFVCSPVNNGRAVLTLTDLTPKGKPLLVGAP